MNTGANAPIAKPTPSDHFLDGGFAKTDLFLAKNAAAATIPSDVIIIAFTKSFGDTPLAPKTLKTAAFINIAYTGANAPMPIDTPSAHFFVGPPLYVPLANILSTAKIELATVTNIF